MESPARMVDSSAHRNNGTTTSITRVSGSSGDGYHFNGSSSIVRVPSSASLNPGKENIWITIHVKFKRIPGPQGYDLLRKGLSTTRGGEYKIEASRDTKGNAARATCTFRGSTATAKIVNLTNVADGAWHTISCGKTSTAIRIVVDGETSAQRVTVGSIANTSPLMVGGKSIGGDWYAGDMDEVSIKSG